MLAIDDKSTLSETENLDIFTAFDEALTQPPQFEDFDKNRDTEFVYEDASRCPAYVMQLSARDMDGT